MRDGLHGVESNRVDANYLTFCSGTSTITHERAWAKVCQLLRIRRFWRYGVSLHEENAALWLQSPRVFLRTGAENRIPFRLEFGLESGRIEDFVTRPRIFKKNHPSGDILRILARSHRDSSTHCRLVSCDLRGCSHSCAITPHRMTHLSHGALDSTSFQNSDMDSVRRLARA